MRRLATRKNNQRTTYPLGSLIFDTQKQTLSNETTNIKLTTKECELLTLLCLNVNNILQRDYALKAIWVDDNYFNARSMDVYITKLRKHLKDDPNVEIINVHGKGYKLVAPNFD
jgi:DNA-binding response OmpR family regulator